MITQKLTRIPQQVRASIPPSTFIQFRLDAKATERYIRAASELKRASRVVGARKLVQIYVFPVISMHIMPLAVVRGSKRAYTCNRSL